jgi:prepilin-type N-terminal cleavage/methylation domain-containing protein
LNIVDRHQPNVPGPSSGRALANGRGFTLIELLTVIAIIGVLTAILVPTAASARRAVRKAKTRAQFAQWAAAIGAFRLEYGIYPELESTGPGAHKVNGNVTGGLAPGAPHRFHDLLAGVRRDGTTDADEEGAVPGRNFRYIAFLEFTANEIVGGKAGDSAAVDRGGLLCDAFGNTDIAVLLDYNLDGRIAVGTDGGDHIAALPGVSPPRFLPAQRTRPARRGHRARGGRGPGAFFMKVFEHYARYYDLLYRDKDYAAESRFVHGLVQAHAPRAALLFELGCGTGRHALEFARLGYRVAGIDRSAEMVELAAALYTSQPAEIAARLQAKIGDVRSHREGGEFDAVVSLFHVINYQTSADDLTAMMATAAAHLRSGGVFLFDFWYGPAVLTDPPRVRVRRLQDKVIDVTRIAEPELQANENRVDVHYRVLVREPKTGVGTEIRETHGMRYLFLPEIEALLAGAGFTLQATGAWPHPDRPLGMHTWYGWALARAGDV